MEGRTGGRPAWVPWPQQPHCTAHPGPLATTGLHLPVVQAPACTQTQWTNAVRQCMQQHEPCTHRATMQPDPTRAPDSVRCWLQPKGTAHHITATAS